MNYVVTNNRYFLTHCFFYEKRRARKKSIGGIVFLKEKFSILLSKTRCLQRNSSRTPFKRSDERIPRRQAKGMRNSQ